MNRPISSLFQTFDYICVHYVLCMDKVEQKSINISLYNGLQIEVNSRYSICNGLLRTYFIGLHLTGKGAVVLGCELELSTRKQVP